MIVTQLEVFKLCSCILIYYSNVSKNNGIWIQTRTNEKAKCHIFISE